MAGRKMLHVFSGGLDSTVLLYDLLDSGNEVVCVNFDYGSKHNSNERAMAVKTCQRFRLKSYFIHLPFVGSHFKSVLLSDGGDIPEGHYEDESMRSTVVPFRNGIMLSIAAGMAESNDCFAVSYAAHSGDHAIYPDCTPSFFNSISEAIAFGTHKRIKLSAPYMFMDKAEIVARGARLKVPFTDTWTCYKGLDVHCGVCGACVERKEAFGLAGVLDPTAYMQ